MIPRDGTYANISTGSLLRTRQYVFPGLSNLETRIGDSSLIDDLFALAVAILFITYPIQPRHRAAIELFGDGDMRH
jgi:hypothetical protein